MARPYAKVNLRFERRGICEGCGIHGQLLWVYESGVSWYWCSACVKAGNLPDEEMEFGGAGPHVELSTTDLFLPPRPINFVEETP